ncbi:hypothetical protein pb186bvf_010016 [Paramecium bursaria]
MSVPSLSLFRRRESAPYERSYYQDYEPPMRTLQKYEQEPLAPHYEAYRQRYVEPEVLEYEPDIMLPIPQYYPEHNYMSNYGYYEKKHYDEQQFQQDLQMQINFGPKRNETKPKQYIDNYYRNMTISYNQYGQLDVNNYKYPEKDKYQPIPENLSNEAYKNPKYKTQWRNGPDNKYKEGYSQNRNLDLSPILITDQKSPYPQQNVMQQHPQMPQIPQLPIQQSPIPPFNPFPTLDNIDNQIIQTTGTLNLNESQVINRMEMNSDSQVIDKIQHTE